ncbi:hypothetical protein AB1N83_010923 [Pleurotus pulmonarius]
MNASHLRSLIRGATPICSGSEDGDPSRMAKARFESGQIVRVLDGKTTEHPWRYSRSNDTHDRIAPHFYLREDRRPLGTRSPGDSTQVWIYSRLTTHEGPHLPPTSPFSRDGAATNRRINTARGG